MKFKDNIFYKAYEVKRKSDNFKPKKVEDAEKYIYDFDIGVSVALSRLLVLSLNDKYSVQIELDFADFERNEVYSPDEALELLKDREVDDLESISIEIDCEIGYFSESFYFYQEKAEVKFSSTYYGKEEEEDPYDIY